MQTPQHNRELERQRTASTLTSFLVNHSLHDITQRATCSSTTTMPADQSARLQGTVLLRNLSTVNVAPEKPRFRPRWCYCSYYQGVWHPIQSERTWRTHKTREAQINRGARTLLQLRSNVLQIHYLSDDEPMWDQRHDHASPPPDNPTQSISPQTSTHRHNPVLSAPLITGRAPSIHGSGQVDVAAGTRLALYNAMANDHADQERHPADPEEYLGLMQQGLIDLPDDEFEEVLRGISLEPNMPDELRDNSREDPPLGIQQPAILGENIARNPAQRPSNHAPGPTVENMDELYGLPGYDYVQQDAIDPWSDHEILSFLLFDIKRAHNVTRAAHHSYIQLIKTINRGLNDVPEPLSLTTTLKRLMEITGVQHKSYDCCVNSCMAFTEQIEASHCTHCSEPRLGNNGNHHSRNMPNVNTYAHSEWTYRQTSQDLWLYTHNTPHTTAIR